MGILSKTRFEASQAVFWALSGCPELKLAKKSCGVPVDGALHRKKNFEISFDIFILLSLILLY